MNLLARERFNYKDMPSLEELETKAVLLLKNRADYGLDFPEPMQPNIIQVGGLQIRDPKPLPENLDTFIKKGKKGTVVVSFGTMFKSELLKKEVQIEILETFKHFPDYNFLWKFEADELPMAKPENVEISKFLPLKNILAHPNIKAFVTHGGVLSMQESLWYGKPMVGMPFSDDQRQNFARVIHLGTAEKLDYDNFSSKSFIEALGKVLGDPR
jgi:glucuronosyltransferase